MRDTGTTRHTRAAALSAIVLSGAMVFHGVARAGLIDDIRNLIQAIDSLATSAARLCDDGAAAVTSELLHYADSADAVLAGDVAQADGAVTQAGQVADELVRRATTGDFKVSRQDMEKAKSDVRALVLKAKQADAGLRSQTPAVKAAITELRQVTRASQGDALARAKASFAAVMKSLKDYALDLLGHPWRFDAGEARRKVDSATNAAHEALKAIAADMKNATQQGRARLLALLDASLDARNVALEAAGQAKATLRLVLGLPPTQSVPPPRPLASLDFGSLAARVDAQLSGRLREEQGNLAGRIDAADVSFRAERPKAPRGKAGAGE